MFRVIPEGKNFKEHVLLKDGQGILLRPAENRDKELIKEFLSRVSQESLRMRFMVSVSQVPEETINMFSNCDFKEMGCLLAIVGEGEEEKVIGLGNYITSPNGRSAEVAFLIEDDYQGKGIGTILLERLAGIAAGHGIVEFEAEVLPENISMLKVFKGSGFGIHQSWSSDTVHLEFPVEGAAWLWERAGLREKIAVANSIKPLLAPKTIAVIGASRDENSIGNKIFRHLIEGNFRGTVYPVNQKAESISGVKAYSQIADLPTEIDLAVISIPAPQVCEVAEKAIHKGAKGLVVVSAGFAEAGEEGKAIQKELVNIVRTHGVRLVGPSCLGIINTDPAISMNASLAPKMIGKGSAGFFSHSAALGIVVLKYAEERGIGFTSFVSAGNRADVSGNDLLQYWEEDPDTKYAILYLETFGNPRRFVRIARRMSYKKPILCVKSARSSIGRKAVEAKSGKAINSELELKALFAQTGMIVTETLEELFDVAVILSHQPLPKGDNVGIIANSAGMATLFADAGEANGLNITESTLLNLGAFASSSDYETAVKKMLINENVDSLLIGFAGLGNIDPKEIFQAITKGIAKARQSNGKDKPIVLCFMGEYGTLSFKDESNGVSRQIPSFRFPEAAARALAKTVEYSKFVRNPAGKLLWYEDVQPDKARKLVTSLLSDSDVIDTIEISEDNTKQILNLFGLTFNNIENGTEICVNVNPDPLFGPTIQITDSNALNIVRITPLTESDLAETMKEMGLEGTHPVGEFIGRISQLIEEIPWLWELKTVVSVDGTCSIKEAKMTLKPGGSKLPNY